MLTAENKAGDTRNKSTEETVEGKSASKTTVDELNDTRQKDVQQIGVDYF